MTHPVLVEKLDYGVHITILLIMRACFKYVKVADGMQCVTTTIIVTLLK